MRRCTRFAERGRRRGADRLRRAAATSSRSPPSPAQPFDSYFSGNTVQICPVGALTAKPYRFARARGTSSRSRRTCTTCAVGCRVAVQSSGNRLTRAARRRLRAGQPRLALRQGPLRLRGRSTASTRATRTSTRATSAPTHHRADGAQGRRARVGQLGRGARRGRRRSCARRPTQAPDGVGAIGGRQLTNEGAFAWAALLKGVVGHRHVDAQFGDGLDAAPRPRRCPRATIDEARQRPHASWCSPGDLREELPVLFLRLRERRRGASAARHRPRTSQLGAQRAGGRAAAGSPGDAAAIARALAGDDAGIGAVTSAPGGRDLHRRRPRRGPRALMGERRRGRRLRRRPRQPGRGRGASSRRRSARSPSAPRRRRSCPALRRSNVNGALDMGSRPGLLPGRVALDDRGDRQRRVAALPPRRSAHASSSSQRSLTALSGRCCCSGQTRPRRRRRRPRAAGLEAAHRRRGHRPRWRRRWPTRRRAARRGRPRARRHDDQHRGPRQRGSARRSCAPGRRGPTGRSPQSSPPSWAPTSASRPPSEVTDQIARRGAQPRRAHRARLEQADAVEGSWCRRSREQSDADRRRSTRWPFPGISAVDERRPGRPPVRRVSVRRCRRQIAGAARADLDAAGRGAGARVPPRRTATRCASWPLGRLYDDGIAVAGPSPLPCSALRPSAWLDANPYDLDRLGVASGEPGHAAHGPRRRSIAAGRR